MFLLIGFRLTDIMGQVGDRGLGVAATIGLGLLCVVILAVVRVGFVVPVILWLRHVRQRGRATVQRIRQASEDYRRAGHPRTEWARRRRHADARRQREKLPQIVAVARSTDEDSVLALRQELHRMMLEAEQAALHDARSASAYSSRALSEAQHLVDRGMWREDDDGAH